MNRQDILERLSAFPYNRDEFWVITGAAMVLYGIREQTSDIDLGCSKELADRLYEDGFFYRLTSDGKRWFKFGDEIELFEDWLYDTVETIEGVSVISVKGLIEMKQILGREKDNRDIELIKEYLKNNESRGGKMLRLRPYKSCDAEIIEKWILDKDVFMKWGGDHFGEFPVSGHVIDERYRLYNGDCSEPDNFYPWVAFDDEHGVVGHFIMRYLNGDDKLLRFGWVIVDPSVRGKGYGSQMLRAGLKYAFEILGVDKVTIGVYENNALAHNCYLKVGFTDTAVKKGDPWNTVEMEILKQSM